jgi:hypothetical protein
MGKLRNNPFTVKMAEVIRSVENNNLYRGLPRGTTRGVIVDVNDPENRGRVRVLFDAMNSKDIPAVEESGNFSEPREGEPSDYSDWLDVSPSFVGKQPEGMKGKRVNISLSNGQYQYAVVQDILYDPQNQTEQGKKDNPVPDNSTMTRLPVYKAGNLPPPCAENHGCMVIEEGGPMGASWTCVCLIRNGRYIWVRHSDLAHAHAGGNDVTLQVDSSGNRPSPGMVGTSYDYVIPTSDQELKKFTSYSSAPSGNPYGEEARWHPSPMSNDEPRPFQVGEFFDQTFALNFTRNSEFPDSIPGAFSSFYNPDISSIVETVPGVNGVKQALDKAQGLLNLTQQVGQALSDPNGFLKDVSKSVIKGYLPPATEDVLNKVGGSGPMIEKVFSALPKLPNPFL